MDDGCDFMLSQILDSVETEIKMENSLGQLGNLYISYSIDMYFGNEDTTNMNFETIDFDMGIFSRENSLEQNDADMKTETFDCVKEFQNGRFAEGVSDNDLQQLIESQSNPNTRRITKWTVEMFNKWRESNERNECSNTELLVTTLCVGGT